MLERSCKVKDEQQESVIMVFCYFFYYISVYYNSFSFGI